MVYDDDDYPIPDMETEDLINELRAEIERLRAEVQRLKLLMFARHIEDA